jgi:hypothetical protein
MPTVTINEGAFPYKVEVAPPKALPYYRTKALRGKNELIYARFTGPFGAQLDGFPDFSQTFVNSEVTPKGYYRWLVACAASISNAGIGAFPVSIELVPPSSQEAFRMKGKDAGGITSIGGQFFQGDGAGVLAFTHKYTAILGPTVGSVKIHSGRFNDAFNTSQNDTQIDSVVGLPMPIPEGWSILAWPDALTNGNMTGKQISLSMAYYELPNGTPYPERVSEAQ